MPQFNVRWKGRPYRHLPRIRVASLQYGCVGARRYGHIAAVEASQLPHTSALEKIRLQQRISIGRRKHISRRPLGDNITSKLTSERVMSNILLSALESPLGGLEEPVHVHRPATNALHLSDDSFGPAETFSGLSLMLDGQDNSTPSQITAEQAEIVDLKLPVRNRRQRNTGSRRFGGLHDSVVLTDRVRKKSIFRYAPFFGRSRTHDPRLPITRVRHGTKSNPAKYDSRSRPQSIRMGSKPAATDKVSISRRSARLSALPSRTPTQLLALKKFSRGLERHLIAQEALRKACLSLSSPSSSTLSADTVVEFIPYMEEFQAAGLAVTSVEQRKPAISQARQEIVQQPLKKVGEKGQVLANATERMTNGIPVASIDGSSGGLYTDTASCRSQVIAFSNCSELDRIGACPVGNIPLKKAALPWLRKAQAPSPTSKSNPLECMKANKKTRLSSESTCETCVTTVIDFSPKSVEIERKLAEPDPSHIGLRVLDVGGINKDEDSVKGKDKEIIQPVVPKRPVRTMAGPQNSSTNAGRIRGHKSFPKDLSAKANQRTRITLDSLGSHQLSVMTVGEFRSSRKPLAQQRSPRAEEFNPVNASKDASAPTHQASIQLLPVPPSQPPPSLPRQDRPSASKLARESPDLSIEGQHSFETPSSFRQALHNVVNESQSLQEQFVKEEEVVANPSTGSSRHRINGDPEKRKSTPYKSPKLSPHASSSATMSSPGLVTTSESQTSTSLDYSDIRDKDVFKGLQIALAAACSKDLDLWITKMSGCRVRRFLADLRAFEGLGVNTLADQAKRTAKKRREERDQKLRGHKYGHVQDHELSVVQEKPQQPNERKRRPTKAHDGGRRGSLVAQMLDTRLDRAGETVKERALAMGWRSRSVSAGY